MIQKFPRPINPKIKTQTDDQIAKVGQLNQLIRDINNLNVGGTANTGIPFEFYPPASLVNEGPKFTYLPTSGVPSPNGIVDLISYHVKGIIPISTTTGSFISQYLCTVSLDDTFFFFPGNLTGMVSVSNINSFTSSPLADGAKIWSNDTNDFTTLTGVSIQAYAYMGNPQSNGKYYYALVLEATGGQINLQGLAAYDYEILFPNFIPAPTIFQD